MTNAVHVDIKVNKERGTSAIWVGRQCGIVRHGDRILGPVMHWHKTTIAEVIKLAAMNGTPPGKRIFT
jgi:hypothetical protein